MAQRDKVLDFNQREKALRMQIEEINRVSYNTAAIARETCAVLGDQDITLDQVDRVLEEEVYYLERSRRVIGNMTFSGWLYNKFVAKPLEPPLAPLVVQGEVRVAQETSTSMRDIDKTTLFPTSSSSVKGKLGKDSLDETLRVTEEIRAMTLTMYVQALN